MKFNDVYKKIAIHIEDNTPEDLIEGESLPEEMKDSDEVLSEVLNQATEIKKIEMQCEELDAKIQVTGEAYDYIYKKRTSGAIIDKTDFDIVTTKLNTIGFESLNIDITDLKIYTESFKTHAENDLFTAVDIMTEDIGSIMSKLFTALKNLIIKIIDMIKTLYVKLLTLYPVLQTNLTKLATYLTDRAHTPRNVIAREELRWITNKAPVIFSMCKDPAQIIAFLQVKRQCPSIGSIYEDGIIYGNAILEAKKMRDDTVLADHIKKVSVQILETPDRGVYAPLQNIIPEINKEEGKVCVIRGDGRTIKYRVLRIDGEENGIPVIRSSIRNVTIDPINEERILIGKIYSLEEVVAIVRADLSYISEIRSFYNGLSLMIRGAKKMVDGIEDLMSTASGNIGLMTTLTRNYYTIARSGLGLLNSDILIGYYNTARDIYYAMYKYADLWFNKGLPGTNSK